MSAAEGSGVGKSLVRRGPTLPGLAVEIRAEVQATEADLHSAVGHAIKAGELLIEAKARCGHGEWLPWLGENFEFSRRHAQRFMQMAANATSVSHLPSVNAALKELTPPATTRRVAQPLPLHPACEAFPWLPDDEMMKFTESIADHGLIRPVTTWVDEEGAEWLLDGKIRRRACGITGVPLEAERYEGDDPWAFTASMNVHRKQRGPAEKRACEAATAEYERQSSGGAPERVALAAAKAEFEKLVGP
jgi:hypothetical protein